MHANPLFVIGMWRSGTSLLYALLNQNPEVKLLYESDLPLLWPVFLTPARRSWAQRLDFWNAAIRRHRIDSTRLSTVSDLSTAFATMARQYASTTGASVWGCKSPNYYKIVPKLARDFPQARYIFLWRDPEKICASIFRAADKSIWFRKKAMWRRALFGCEILKGACDELRASGVMVHELYYRDLVDNPERTMREVCQFLCISFSPAMTSLQGADLSPIYDGEHHDLLRNAGGIRNSSNNGAHDSCPPRIRRKIQRYKVLWKQKFPNWRVAAAPESTTTPAFAERCIDCLLFRMLQAMDCAPRWVFAFLPLWCWRKYRRLKYGNEDRFIKSPAVLGSLSNGNRASEMVQFSASSAEHLRKDL